MNQQTVGELVYKITGDVSDLKASLTKAEGDIKKMQGELEKTGSTAKKTESTFSKLGVALKGAFAFLIGGQVIGFLRGAVQAASDRLEQETRLAQILRTSTNATDDQIRALREQAQELEKIGVLDKQIITTVQAQLSTFDLRAESIKTLTPAILDYVAAEKGSNATQEEAQQLTNGLAQALQGKFASLTQVGFVLDEETKAMIANGTETERSAALVEVLNSTYKDVNKTLAGTFLGTMSRTKRAFGDLQEDLGFALMPALQILGEEVFGLSGDIGSGSDRVNTWGKRFYQLANILVVVGKTFKITGIGIDTFGKMTSIAITKVLELITKLRISIGKLKGDDVSGLESTLSSYETVTNDLLNKIAENGDAIIEEAFEMGDAMNQALDPTGFKEVTDAQISEYKRLQDETEQFGDGVSDAAKKAAQELESFQEKIVGFVESSKELSKTLRGDLSDAFKEFGENVATSLDETNEKLAEITIGAQDKIAELKASLKDEDDSDKRKEIKAEIKKQQEILDSRKGFEKRQAEEIAKIREKLTAAGIDAGEISGLDGIATLEEEIAEQKRVAALDEFARFEEQQLAKLTKIADDFITEVALIRGKIDTQIAYEQELTNFLASTTDVRTQQVNDFAVNAIAKYGEVADELQSLLTLQTRVNNATGLPQYRTGGYVDGRGGEVHSGEYVVPSNLVGKYSSLISSLENERRGGGAGSSTTINAPVTINGASMNGNISANELSAIMGFELNKFIR